MTGVFAFCEGGLILGLGLWLTRLSVPLCGWGTTRKLAQPVEYSEGTRSYLKDSRATLSARMGIPK